MSTWKALNIESDDESDIEVDDTKELQIEDALKLYQTALKYHAEGPNSWDYAADAYAQLFQSDIFRYPESLTELRRIELYGPLPDDDPLFADGLGVAVASGSLETGPSTLPQILHLSHKNYAQFKLEYLTSRLDTLNVTLHQILGEAASALNHFVEALDKDDTDLDLWRRTAAVGEILDSRRVARFCLEAVLEGDNEGLTGVLSSPGLEESLAGAQLRGLIAKLDDQLSALQAPLSTSTRRVLSKLLKQRLVVYGGIKSRVEALAATEGRPGQEPRQPDRVTLKSPKTWAEVGDALLRQLNAESFGTNSMAPGSAIGFNLSNVPRIANEDLAAPRAEPMAIEAAPVTHSEILKLLPATIAEQFPGLDKGKPTVQPQIAAADPSMHVEDSYYQTPPESPTMTLPSRKRSGETAGLPQDGNEEGRTKSRRIRARGSEAADGADNRQAVIDANVRWEYEQQLNEFQAVDDWMFETVSNLFERIGVVGFEKGKEVRQEINAGTAEQDADHPMGESDQQTTSSDPLHLAKQDILAFLKDFSDRTAFHLLQGGDTMDLSPSGTAATLTSSPGKPSKRAAKSIVMSEAGLYELLQEVNDEWLLTQEVAFKWLMEALLLPGRFHDERNTYAQYLWPDALKTMVVRTLVNFDEPLYLETQARLRVYANEQIRDNLRDVCAWAEAIQGVFELHLDIYTLIKEPNSGVDVYTITSQGDRLRRWAELAGEAMELRRLATPSPSLNDDLGLRFLWATTFHIAASPDEVTQDHIIECMNDLRAVLTSVEEQEGDSKVIYLQNNAVMPEVSLSALDREISRLTTKDFFLKVTSQDVGDPVGVIESLEPLLLSLDDIAPTADDTEETDMDSVPAVPQVPPELVRFLQASALSVRLVLWNRLRDAYVAIDHKPMIVTTLFRIIGVILKELKANLASGNIAQGERQIMVLKSVHVLQDLISKALTLIRSCDNGFECVDDSILRKTVVSMGEVLQLLQVFNVFEDSLRVGQSQPPTLPNGMPIPSFASMNAMIHDMQLHIWMIIYGLLKEAIYQNPDAFPNFVEDKFDFLRVVHRNLGLRGICGGSNRMFVRMLRDEIVHMTSVEGYDSEQAQVLYDLYRLNCFMNPSYELIEHHCTHDAFLERGVARQAVDLLLAQAQKLPIKELVKHPLRETIERVHGSVPRKKPTEAILRNREIYRTFLRSPINPLDLYNCVKGEGNQLPVSLIPKQDADLASKGWYFLMGYIALTKFKCQKRTAPTPTEDVEIAIAFFMQDLEFSMDHWETWFRLAQAYDTKIEESVVWSAEKLNNNMTEIVQQQRAAIHCYTMAIALAHRSAALGFETNEKITELYQDFAMRMYSSSREPFSMLPFDNGEVEKFVSTPLGMDKRKAFLPLKVYTAWKFAKSFFSRAITGKSGSWSLHYMLGKALWKMHAAPEHLKGRRDQPPSAEKVLQAFIQAIELLPDSKKDSKERKEPTLEPHYKLVSIVHKLFMHGELSLEQAKEALDHTSYSRSVSVPKERADWSRYVLDVLKNLRAADKSNWHHRMINRAAQIVYEENGRPTAGGSAGDSAEAGAKAAKHELTQQMFTKTMVLQVWRPECERAGRHFVYTARYTRFFTKILEQLKDRQNLEALARRVRRRPHDVFEHSLVWQDICNAYLRLLRSYAKLPEGLETSTFNTIAHEEFLQRKEPLERWMQAQDPGTAPALDVLREVQELKKVNQGLMKPGLIDDLIGDAYAYLFANVGKQLWAEEQRIKQEEARKPPPPAASPPRNPVMNLNHLMNLDGAGDGFSSAASFAPTPTVVPSNAAGPAMTEPPARKKIGIGRREIRTCAESCNQKAIPVPANKALGTKVQVVIDNSRQFGGESSAGTSAPGSVHDDADDESELSELEEEGDGDVEDNGDAAEDVKEEPDGGDPASRPSFPNLAQTTSREESAGFQTAEEEPTGEATADGDGDVGMRDGDEDGKEDGVPEDTSQPLEIKDSQEDEMAE
jgi:tetratricopeptide (TPR) repeat protein